METDAVDSNPPLVDAAGLQTNRKTGDVFSPVMKNGDGVLTPDSCSGRSGKESVEMSSKADQVVNKDVMGDNGDGGIMSNETKTSHENVDDDEVMKRAKSDSDDNHVGELENHIISKEENQTGVVNDEEKTLLEVDQDVCDDDDHDGKKSLSSSNGDEDNHGKEKPVENGSIESTQSESPAGGVLRLGPVSPVEVGIGKEEASSVGKSDDVMSKNQLPCDSMDKQECQISVDKEISDLTSEHKEVKENIETGLHVNEEKKIDSFPSGDLLERSSVVSINHKLSNSEDKEDNKFDDANCDLLVFDMKEGTSKDKEIPEESGGSHYCNNSKAVVGNSIQGVYTQPVFEDITEDEDSDDEQFENIELELDDLIDTPDASLNSSNNSMKGDVSGTNRDREVESSSSEKMNLSTLSSAVKSEILSIPISSTAYNNGMTKDIDSNSNVNGEVDCKSSTGGRKSYENVDPSGIGSNCDIQTKSSAGISVVKPLMRKKSTARKSGKPVSQMESAPLKRINMYPITDVTMNISEVEEALKFDMKKVKKSDSSTTSSITQTAVESNQQGNSYKVISVTTKPDPGIGIGKKKRKKRSYDLPGCKKSKKKFKLLDDIASTGASSVDSVSLSESDLVESDSLSISSSSSTHIPLSEFNNHHQNHRDSTIGCTTTSSSLVSLSSSLFTSSLSASSPLSSVSSSSASAMTKPGANKGSNKMKSVLDMLHERNRQKTASSNNDNNGVGGNGNWSTTASTTTTTTTTIMVSPPEHKLIVEGVKRKGTPRKRRDDVICVSDDDEDMDTLHPQPNSQPGKRNSLDAIGRSVGVGSGGGSDNINPTTMLCSTPNNSNMIPAAAIGGSAPVVMMVAQHSSQPGLRSLLPRNVLVSAAPIAGSGAGLGMGMAMIRPEAVGMGGLVGATSTLGGGGALPLVSTLPAGMKSVIPLSSLPPGSTIFTAVQQQGTGNLNHVGGGVVAANSLPGGATTFLNIPTPPKGSVAGAAGVTPKKPISKSHHPHSLLSSSNKLKQSALKQQLQTNAAQVNSESLRALLVGNKSYSLAHSQPTISIAAPSSLSSSILSSSSSLPLPSSSLLLTPSSASITPSSYAINTSGQMVFQMLNTKTSPPTLIPSSLQTSTTTTTTTNKSSNQLHQKQHHHHNHHHKKSSSSQSQSSTKSNSLTISGGNTYSLIKPNHYSVFPPNGISCLTPPKTPDTDSSSEVAVAASLTRPVGGQFEDGDVIPLCCCKINVPNFNKMLSGVTYCQALDSVDNKMLGCCNKVTSTQLVRPGVKIPFMAVCETHRKRLAKHQCCPGCGHFCSQGKFQECRKEGTAWTHHFHKQCVFYRGGKHFCPHCGEETNQSEVELKLNHDGTASPTPRGGGGGAGKTGGKDADKKVSARLGVGSKKSRAATTSSNNKENKTLTLPNKKSVDPSTLPSGPDQATLTRLCKCQAEDRPKKYRTLAKDLYSPASEGDMEKVFYLLADGMDPNTRQEDQEDQTALHAAAISGSVGTAFILEQFGAEVHAQNGTLQTPLMCAAENGHVKMVQFLLGAQAKVEDRGEDGMTSLHYAAKAGHLAVIKVLLATKKLDINVEDDGGWTPIIWATESMLPDIVQYLLGQGGDPNKKDNEENTALHWAAFSGSVAIADMFLDLGCELDTPNEHGDRPLHIAARQDHYDIVVHLLAKGANVDVKNHKNETPVDACVNKTGQVCMALKVNQQLRGLATYRLIQPERFLDRDITMGREKNPVACVNKEDKEPCPSDYLYVVQNVETSPLNINSVITGLQSCRCKDDCSSMYCVCARSSVCCWYDKTGRLVDQFNLLEPPLVFECNRACRCWVNCNNRVVQNGIICRLQLFRTNGRGWGVRTLMDIPKGTFVCEYIGELISDSEADRREDDSYLFDLDNKDGDTYCIDARKYGNVARFINHLCEPNLVPVKVFVEHQDLRFPRICLFSSREIKAYEELGFDYGEKFWIIKWKQFTCACQSDKCKYSKDTIQKTLDDYKLRYPDETTGQENS